MRLISAEVSGYRRFAAKSELDLDADLVCIVGPNAAGKSSFLDALVHLNDETPFEKQERTRTQGSGEQAVALRADYALEDADLDALKDIPEAAKAETFAVLKSDDGRRRLGVTPRPMRSRERRTSVRELLFSLQKSPWLEIALDGERALDPQPEPPITQLIEDAIAVAESEADNLGLDTDLQAFALLRDRLRQLVPVEDDSEDEEAMPKKYWPLPERLEKLIGFENEPSPHQRAIDALRGRVPRFMKFDDSARRLAATYDLNGDSDQAIENLLVLAGSSWSEARDLMTQESPDKGDKNTLLERMSESLEGKITEAWGQMPLRVKIDLDGTQLTVLMSMRAKDYIEIDQQSDGLRQFVALRAYIALAHHAIKPIVLVDEADIHLHYDAQADLIDVFEGQTEAAKMIYTTHSAGCLPRDLGVGLRAIVPTRVEIDGRQVDTDHSEVINYFWSGDRVDEHGFSPLLIAMGASALAFSASQSALVTEGLADMVLLPSLLREANGTKRLPYQVVPSFARTKPDDIPDLELVAARVAYVADGDEGGRSHAQKLEDNGVRPEQIFFLGGSKSSGYSLEDLVHPETYLKVINAELRNDAEFPASKLPAKGRAARVAKWCEEQDNELVAPGKGTVAQRVLALRKTGVSLVDPNRADDLKRLDDALQKLFEKGAHRIAEARQTGTGI